ncbi:MAG TPA: PEGA domain-containing protein [Bacteroidales bacterium]|nr:PEGA domain-containing protein [Bacteroidales bacterium]
MKKPTVSKTIISSFLAVLILLSSCVSTTMIQSRPPEAKIYIDGQPSGTTPYSYSDTKIVGSTTTIKIEKEGYETMDVILSRDEQADVGAIIGGVFVLVPFLWTMKYNPTHTYELTPIKEKVEQTTNVQAPENIKSKAERLRELKKLLDEKILTQEEYEKEKQKILDEDE